MDKSPTSKFRMKWNKILSRGSFKTRSTPASPVSEKICNKFRFEANSLDSLNEMHRPKSLSTSGVGESRKKSPSTVRKTKSLRYVSKKTCFQFKKI
ncbi:hypothetical protein WA026_010752 [Henosepilachna vigintioctopunctata]